MDKFIIKDLMVEATLGIYPWEQKIKRQVKFNIEYAIDAKLAAKTDDVTSSIDYAEIINTVSEYVGSQSFHLLETMAEKVAALLKQNFSITWLKLSVHKLQPLKHTQEVIVEIER